jgi:hypothetical protein
MTVENPDVVDIAAHQNDAPMVLVLDGGTCFFNFKCDPGKNQLIELFTNGDA